MSRRRQAARAGLFGVLAAGLVSLLGWYFCPIDPASLDTLSLCPCGMSEVRFGNGQIVLIRGVHDSSDSGKVVGSYSRSGSRICLQLQRHESQYTEECLIDHLGVRRVAPVIYKREYVAIPSRSLKLRFWFFVQRGTERVQDWLAFAAQVLKAE